MRWPRPGALLLALVSITFMPSCGTHPDEGRAHRAEKSPTSAASDAASPSKRLPIAAFAYSDSDFRIIMAARKRIVRECVARFGLSTPKSLDSYWSPADPLQDRRYGVVDIKAASKYGYHMPPSATVTDGSISKKLREVLTGNGEVEIDGISTDPKGCVGESDKEFPVNQQNPGAEAAARVNVDSFDHSLKDRTLQKYLHRWSDCMKSNGYAYSSPLQSIGDKRFTGPTVSSAEIKTATADVTCKETSHLVQEWINVETVYQTQQIRSHRTELRNLQNLHAAVLAKARETIG